MTQRGEPSLLALPGIPLPGRPVNIPRGVENDGPGEAGPHVRGEWEYVARGIRLQAD
jgi:hypothetical protein